MGRQIIVQRRGKGSMTYQASKKAFKYKLQIPINLTGEGSVLKLLNSGAHSVPVAKIKSDKGTFYIPAFKNMYEGQKISFDGEEVKDGNVLKLKDIPVKTKVYCIESRQNDGGKYIKSGGNHATVGKVMGKDVFLVMPSKQEKKLSGECRAIVGVTAGAGKLEKPVLKAGKKHHIKKTKSKLWPRTSACKMNANEHPFGSGRGRNPKSRIAKRNAPAGAKVGKIRPRQTGKRK